MSLPNIISVVGPTATGKTDVALAIAHTVTAPAFPRRYDRCILISADSRQVYRGLELLSGADIPEGFRLLTDTSELPYWANQDGTIELHGVSCISPNEEWSAAHFTQFSRKLLQMAKTNNILPVVVGGTGFYHQQLDTPAETQGVSPNKALRAVSQTQTVEELQLQLARLNPQRLAGMNNSDRHNKRRLIRAIEVAPQTTSRVITMSSEFFHEYIGLTDTTENLTERIQKRVAKRLEQPVLNEVAAFSKNYPDHSLPAWTTTGLQEIEQYLAGNLTKEQCIALWTLHEVQYAKRQLVWWKKREATTWFSASEPTAQQQAVQLVSELLTRENR